jgi:hypothetical protein
MKKQPGPVGGLFSAPAPRPSGQLGKVGEWSEALERLWSEVGMLHHSRDIFAFFSEELKKLPHAFVVQWTLTHWYVDAQASLIRRLTWPGGNKTESLYTLLTDMQKHSSVLGAERHGVPTAGIPEDLTRLREVARKEIGLWTTQNVAHMGLKRTAQLDEGEFNAAIDVLGTLLKKYYLLVRGAEPGSVAPPLPRTWKDPFRQAWLPQQGENAPSGEALKGR